LNSSVYRLLLINTSINTIVNGCKVSSKSGAIQLSITRSLPGVLLRVQ
jgi:hypothetical protein